MNDDPVLIPRGPLCLKCGHECCPLCADSIVPWCYTLVGDDGDQCCDGECEFPPGAVEAWREEIKPALDLAHKEMRPIQSRRE